MDYGTDFDAVLPFLKKAYEEKMPFNKYIGIVIDTLTGDETVLRIDMTKNLIGNYSKSILHGGVISSLVDVTGGLMASVELLKRIAGSHPDEIARKFGGMATIDMRVDFLRPGKGSHFLAKGRMIRFGASIALVQTDIVSDSGKLVATGTAAYRH